MTAAALVVAIIGLLGVYFVPEVRIWLGLEKRPAVSAPAPAVILPPSSPSAETEPQPAEPIHQTSKSRVTGKNNVTGNNVTGNFNVVGNDNRVIITPPPSVSPTTSPSVQVEPSPADSPKPRMSVTDRPYVFAVDVQFIEDEQDIRIKYHNSGKTPAIDLGLSYRYALGENFDLDTIKLEDFDKPSSNGDVPADGWLQSDLPSGKNAMPDKFDMMKKGQWHGYIFGFLRYTDLDGLSYEPRFCFMWLASTNSFAQCPANPFTAGQKLN